MTKSPVRMASQDENGNTRTTTYGATHTFNGVVQEVELAMNLSYGGDTQDDGEGNPISVHLWVNGDWKVGYKGKEYLISMNENISALIDWINSRENK